MQKLIEMCCKCGFVHKDERIVGDKTYRAYKPHYHWFPEGKLVKDNVTLHATICVACCGDMDWKEFYEQKNLTAEKYRVKFSLNAPLPDRFLEWASELYKAQAKYFEFE